MGAGMIRFPLQRGLEQLFGPCEIRVVTGQQAQQIERLGIAGLIFQNLDAQGMRFPVGLPGQQARRLGEPWVAGPGR